MKKEYINLGSRLIGAIGAIVTCVSVIDFSTNSFGSLGINLGLLLTIGIVTFLLFLTLNMNYLTENALNPMILKLLFFYVSN